MRARNIKPGFFKNEELAALRLEYRVLFQGLWCLADREGRLEDRPLRIKAEIFPYDNFDVNSGLSELEDAGFIQRYEVNGAKYIQIVSFSKHQNPHPREAKSTIPPVPKDYKAKPGHGLGHAKSLPSNADSLFSVSSESPFSEPSHSLNPDPLKIVIRETAAKQVPPGTPTEIIHPTKQKALTPIQKVVKAWKIVTGHKDDPTWDKVFFSRFSKPAKDLIEYLGSWEMAVDCIEDLYKKFKKDDRTVTLETIMKHSADWKKDWLEKNPEVNGNGILPSPSNGNSSPERRPNLSLAPT